MSIDHEAAKAIAENYMSFALDPFSVEQGCLDVCEAYLDLAAQLEAARKDLSWWMTFALSQYDKLDAVNRHNCIRSVWEAHDAAMLVDNEQKEG